MFKIKLNKLFTYNMFQFEWWNFRSNKFHTDIYYKKFFGHFWCFSQILRRWLIFPPKNEYKKDDSILRLFYGLMAFPNPTVGCSMQWRFWSSNGTKWNKKWMPSLLWPSNLNPTVKYFDFWDLRDSGIYTHIFKSNVEICRSSHFSWCHWSSEREILAGQTDSFIEKFSVSSRS